ncbi:class I SAM-dependent methyltransferase [Pediococcus siamensis]|uniref:class I SAM-dependent methyltransferase n=1 Tax=Pediococcus siamensis TaxID=381829 RepID=UPI00399F9F45
MITNTSEIESLFKIVDESTTTLQEVLDTSYLDALIETGNNLIAGEVQVEDNIPDEKTKRNLEHFYAEMHLATVPSDAIRQVFQLAALKAVQKDHIQANHQMTPDTIGMLFAYLLQVLSPNETDLKILDPAVGTANLLTTVINDIQKNQPDRNVTGIGIDNDDSMLALAGVMTQLQHLDVDLYHQDALDQLVIDASDAAISDLPVGYYPIDFRVTKYVTHSEKGHSFVHHLLIEQAMNHLKAGGFGLFLVPSNLFQTDQAAGLLRYFKDKIYLQGFLNLPKDLFTNASLQKSILILQNHGEGAKQAAQVLLGDFPSFKEKAKMQKYLGEIRQWKRQNL